MTGSPPRRTRRCCPSKETTHRPAEVHDAVPEPAFIQQHQFQTSAAREHGLVGRLPEPGVVAHDGCRVGQELAVPETAITSCMRRPRR